MHKFLLFILLITGTLSVSAQSVTIDSEKLLNYYQNQKYAEAADYLLSIYPKEGDDIRLLGQIAYFNYMAGALPAAEQYYLKLEKLDPENIQVLLNLARINIRRDNYTEARAYLGNYLLKDSTNFSVLKQMAGLINSAAERKLKIKYLEKANLINRAEGDVANDLAESYLGLKDTAMAYKVLQPAIKADTFNLVLLKTNLLVCLNAKRFPEAIISGEKLLALGDSSTSVLKDMGRTLYGMKEYNKALKMFALIPKTEVNESILYYKTLCYRQLKKYPEAIRSAKETIDEGISVNTANYYSLLGALNESNGKVKEAVSAYKKGLLYKNHSDIYYNLGILYDLKLKNKALALTNYKKYLANVADKEKSKLEIEYVQRRMTDLK